MTFAGEASIMRLASGRGGRTMTTSTGLTAERGFTSAELAGLALFRTVDLSAVDPTAPWVLDPSLPAPRALLSDHPALAALVGREVGAWSTDPTPHGDWDPDRSALGRPLDDALRHAARTAVDDGPDLLDPAQTDAVRTWLVAADDGPGPGFETTIQIGRTERT